MGSVVMMDTAQADTTQNAMDIHIALMVMMKMRLPAVRPAMYWYSGIRVFKICTTHAHKNNNFHQSKKML